MNRRPARGQVLVIFAGGLVVLLAITALVIDLGFAFMIRRQEQNAVDPGAIAAARHIRSGVGETSDYPAMRRAACFYARQNGFFPSAGDDTGCTPGNDPNGTTLTVNFPPGTSAGTYSGRAGFVEVILTRPHRAFFAQVIGMSTIPVSSGAVGAFSDGDSNSSSLIALDPGNTCTAARVHGGATIDIHPVSPGIQGGYVHVNSTCDPPATTDTSCTDVPKGGLVIDGTATLKATHTYVTGTCKSNGSGLVGGLTEGSVQIGDPLAELPPPDLADYPAGKCGPTGWVTEPTGPKSAGCEFKDDVVVKLRPGVYYGGWDVKKNGATLELAPGVYIIAGGGIRLTSEGSITSVQDGLGGAAPVLIYNTDNPATGTGQANIDFNASATLKLRAIETGPYRGILLWNDGYGSNADALISLGGQVSLDISGTIYSPKGKVNMEGGGGVAGVDSTAAVQIIAWQWDVGGNYLIDMPYDPNKLYRFDQKGLVR